MVTIDLTTPPPAADSFLDGLPRRLALTLPELRLAAEMAGDAPLPFEEEQGGRVRGGLAGRLGRTQESSDADAYERALASLHDARGTLARRGLVTGDALDPSLAGAIGLLATPTLALDIDVSAAGMQVKSWQRQSGGAVATLSTCDGIVFEIAWFPVGHWAGELARVTAVPDDVTLRDSAVPSSLDVAFPVLDAVGEALRTGRSDLVPVLLAHHGDGSVDGPAGPLDDAEAVAAVSAVHTEGRGRLRILGAEVSGATTTEVGVVSWVLLADGWHSLTARTVDGSPRVRVRRVDPDDLATELAPVLAQVTA